MINPIALKKLRILLSQNLNTLESNGIGKMIAIQALDTPDLLFRSPSVERLTRSCGRASNAELRVAIEALLDFAKQKTLCASSFILTVRMKTATLEALDSVFFVSPACRATI